MAAVTPVQSRGREPYQQKPVPLSKQISRRAAFYSFKNNFIEKITSVDIHSFFQCSSWQRLPTSNGTFFFCSFLVLFNISRHDCWSFSICDDDSLVVSLHGLGLLVFVLLVRTIGDGQIVVIVAASFYHLARSLQQVVVASFLSPGSVTSHCSYVLITCFFVLIILEFL